jgi:hypothetical protein
VRLGSALAAVAIVAALAAPLAPCPSAAADEVEALLERLGLKQLLALHLEERLDGLTGERRQQEAMRLADLYAELLESVADPLLRRTIEERSKALLRAAPEGSVDQLRLALLRSTFRAAESVAEDQRMRLSSPEAVQQAIDTLTDILPDLGSLESHLEDSVERVDRRLGRASGTEAVFLGDDLERLQRLEMECSFLRAWALYYQSWLNNRPDNARIAQRIFAELLDPSNPFIEPADVSEDLRGAEAVARTILGLALCKSLTASAPTAITWVRLLEDSRTFEAIREQVPAWRIFIHLENGEFRAARSVLNEHLRTNADVPLPWLRLVAVYALEARESTRETRDLISYAVTQLASRAELEQILDLAERYGTESLGESGFALHYVRGVLAYHSAREEHGSDEPSRDMELVRAYATAVDAFRTGLQEPDVNQYVDAAVASQRLIAWCLYFQSEFRDAKQAFELAARTLPAGDAADALWMSIVCQDKLVKVAGTSGVRAELARMITQFLELYPSSEHAPKLLLKQAIATDAPTLEMINGLLAIPASSPVHESARRRAAHLLFGMVRKAAGAERAELASLYLGVAVPIILADAARQDELDEVELQRLGSRCRRVIETALHDNVQRLTAARTALEIVDELEVDSRIDLSELGDEFDYRRCVMALRMGDLPGAAEFGERLHLRTPESSWARLATQSLFRSGYDRWRAVSDGDDDRAAVEWVVRYGERLLGEEGAEALLAAPANVHGYIAAVAEAHYTVWDRSKIDDAGRRALELFRDVLLVKRPRNIDFLRATAVLSEKFGDVDDALECWRLLVSGLPMTEEGWFEAKFHLITILAMRDEDRAREVMQQHETLHPQFGPDPWGPRLRGLAVRLKPPGGDDA